MSFNITKIQPYYDSKIKLHYMDTDSFILSSKTTNLLKDLEYFKNDFDFSELDKNHHLYDLENRKVIGKMKIETSSTIELDNVVAFISKEKPKQKVIQKSPKKESYFKSIFNSKRTTAINYFIRLDARCSHFNCSEAR